MDDRKLELISNIDEDIIERATARRTELASKKNKKPRLIKRLTPILAAVACLCLIMTAVFSFMFGGSGDPSGPGGTPGVKQVPIYTGMTVSTSAPIASASVDSTQNSLFAKMGDFFGIQTLDNSNKVPNVEGNSGNHNGQIKHTDADGNVIEAEGTAPLFYATAGQDFYITVHVHNPDKFEIVSFTLNGEKYTNYMFEPGSDLENLILKCNAGDAMGLVEYTIDAIKYIDGTEIKDVKIEGEQTIKVGLYSEEIQPKVTVNGEKISYDSISFTAKISDNYNRIIESDGVVTVRLYKGNELISSKEIDAKQELNKGLEITFDKLLPATEYTYKIVAEYDSFDGKSKSEHILFEKQYITDFLLYVLPSDISHHTVSLNYRWNTIATEYSIVGLELLLGEEKVRDIPANAIQIDELLSNTEYTLKIKYSSSGVEYEQQIKFETLRYNTPEISFTSRQGGSESSIDIDLSISTMAFAFGNFDHIGIYKGDNLIQTTSLLSDNNRYYIEFENLQSNTKYTIKAIFRYDLKDGKGSQTIKIETIQYTMKIENVNDVKFTTLSNTTSSVSFDFALPSIGSGGYIKVTTIELRLLKNNSAEIVQSTVDSNKKTFYSLLPGESYAIVIHYEYDVNDGTGIHKNFAHKVVTTQSPGLEISNGEIVDIGTCKDSVLYICMPVKAGAFANNNFIQKVYLNAPRELYFEPIIPGQPEKGIKFGSLAGRFTTIGEQAFFSCDSLKNVFFAKDIHADIGSMAFTLCKALENITFCDSVEFISGFTFQNCTKLTTINIPNTVTHIPDVAFYNCTSLQTITLPDTLTTIGSGAFAGCTSLTSITIPDTVTTIYDSAFAECTNLTNIILPKGLTNISSHAFYNCENLVNLNIPDTINIIHDGAFSGCIRLQTLTLPNGVSSIGDAAFSKCQKLTSINIPEGVTYIGISAFSGCENLTNIIIPDTVLVIGNSAFLDCTNLTSVILSNSLEIIDKNMFWGCSNLTEITIPDTVTIIKENAFSNCKALLNIKLPNKLKNIGGQAFFYCRNLRNISIPNTVTTIGDSAFSQCTNLISITLPDSLTTISDSLFSGCENLINITIPNTVTSINSGAFYNCKRLTEIIIPNNVTKIGNSAFANCNSLTEISIPIGVTHIGDRTFYFCERLTKVLLPDGLISIGEEAFYRCNLKDLNLPNTITNIGNGAFYSCLSLTTITIPNGVTCINSNVFEHCLRLREVIIPSSVTLIYSSAFNETYITDIIFTFKGSTSQWENIDKISWNIKGITIHCTDGDIIY